MRRFVLLFFLSLLAFVYQSLAQPSTGQLQGRVIDAATGEGLPGVTVALEGTPYGMATTLDGRFDLRNLPAGRYTLVASLLGYGRHTQALTLEAGGTVDLALTLREEPITLESVLAQAERSYSAASSLALRRFDLLSRPNHSAQDLLRAAPGLIIAQHAGGGKAEQIFLRGFDADHGTDVNLSVDGLPVNMVSHGHGQGYADLHFLIPETVEEMDVRKGPYFAEFGNLATAGAIAFHTRDHLDENLVRLEGGRFETRRLTTLYQIPLPGAHQGAYVAGQFYRSDGPVASPQGFNRVNLFGKFHTHLGEASTLALSVSGFSSAWDASGQIPQRAVASGLIDRFGSLDDREGGTTGRQDVNLHYTVEGDDGSQLLLQSYLSRYNFKLFSNFTFFLDDLVNGDMIEQTDDRQITGLNSRYQFHRLLGRALATTTLGGGFRADDADVALWHSPNRRRLAARVDATLAERNLYLWAQQELTFSPKVQLQLGLRGDYFTFNVEDHLEGQPAVLPHASGYAQQTILSPKANLVVSPTRRLDVFVNAGSGFHSNDARDVILGQRVEDLVRDLRRDGLDEAQIDAALVSQNLDPAQREAETLPRATGGELGFQVRPTNRLLLAAAAWVLDLEREFVYVGDGGFTELSGATRRYGLDLEARLQLRPWLWADADVNLARGFFKDAPDDERDIALAPRVTSTGGLTLRHPRGLDGSLRYRHVGDRPANEAGTVTAAGYTLVDALATWRRGPVGLTMAVENLLDVAWNEAQFDTESRLRNEAEPVSELHFTPGTPRSLRLGVSYHF
jgi:hypothetical protein